MKENFCYGAYLEFNELLLITVLTLYLLFDFLIDDLASYLIPTATLLFAKLKGIENK